jgi:hypothetical protein
MIICDAGDIHGAMSRMYEEILSFLGGLRRLLRLGASSGDFDVWPDADWIDPR